MRHLPMTTQQERDGVSAQDLTQGFIVIFISNILERTTNTAQEDGMVKRTVTFMTRETTAKDFPLVSGRIRFAKVSCRNY